MNKDLKSQVQIMSASEMDESVEWEEAANKLLDMYENKDGTSETAGNEQELDVGSSQRTAFDENTLSAPECKPAAKSLIPNIVQKINKLDPNYTLTIHKYLSELNEDPLINEYCEKLIVLDFIPTEPTEVELLYYEPNLSNKFDFSEETLKMCVYMLVSYFDCCNLKIKLKKAEYEKSVLFEVTTTSKFSGEMLFTCTGHERLSSLKNCLVTQMQRAAAIENDFVMELLLVRICFLILQSNKERNATKNETTYASIKRQFVLLYIKVKYEYTSYFEKQVLESQNKDMPDLTINPKDSFNEPIYPSWRLQNCSPPLFYEQSVSPIIFDQVKNSLATLNAKEVFEKL